MRKVFEFLGRIAKDKWEHYTICLIIALLAAIIGRHLYSGLGKGELTR